MTLETASWKGPTAPCDQGEYGEEVLGVGGRGVGSRGDQEAGDRGKDAAEKPLTWCSGTNEGRAGSAGWCQTAGFLAITLRALIFF